jgi:hypothetical protein
MCAGGCRGLIDDSVKYAAQRRQFGQPIASFGAIKHKLGEMIARTYAIESLSYRTAGLIDEALANGHDGAALARVFEEYRESSIAKVVVPRCRLCARRERSDPRRQRLREGLHRRVGYRDARLTGSSRAPTKSIAC